MIKNTEIAKILREMAAFYEMQNVPFKPRAYEKAASSIESLDEQISEIHREQGFKGLRKIPGVGQAIAEHIEELLRTGHLRKHDQLKKKIPVDITELASIEGLGPKTAMVLYQKLRIKTVKDLKQAVLDHKLRVLKGFGEKSEANFMQALDLHDTYGQRFLLGQIFAVVQKFKNSLAESGLFDKVEVGGSFRRRQETVGDIDILATARNQDKAMNFFTKHQDVVRVLERGQTKSVIKLASGLQVDLRIVPKQSWGAALQYFTGDRAHNIKMRKIAIGKSLKLSEYGIFPVQKSKVKSQKFKSKIKTETETQVYEALGMDYIEPELRTDSGEIEAALRQVQGKQNVLPKLINYGDVRGDLQVQTNWTDGTASILEMAKAAAALGREYIAITDHTKTLYMTGGLDEKKLLKQMKEIDRVNETFRLGSARNSFRILKGAEVNILKDGSLDIDDKILSKLEVVGVSIHSHFKMARADMTKRIVQAMSNPHVVILFHPTTRIIQRREPIDFDFPAILKAAKKYRVALEIDAFPDRLDLHDTMIRQAVEAGVKLVIDTDAHSTKHLNYIHFGEAQARRGWATKNDVLNAKSVEDLLKYFQNR